MQQIEETYCQSGGAQVNIEVSKNGTQTQNGDKKKENNTEKGSEGQSTEQTHLSNTVENQHGNEIHCERNEQRDNMDRHQEIEEGEIIATEAASSSSLPSNIKNQPGIKIFVELNGETNPKVNDESDKNTNNRAMKHYNRNTKTNFVKLVLIAVSPTT
ncbi:hypothetical protein K7X08_037978 [Anisodus acutangulus]|uniref:Uncharacterized protein n=1 Tax=Anisodus acutangulus TaxID=402998 RepID=A0A9Q1N3F3_9SOLA|nr:hypothetical protein K7X08_037978 [Anisodus acutangulus]